MTAKVRPAAGAAISVLGLMIGAAAWQLAPFQASLIVRVLFLLVAWFTFWFFIHDLTHHVVGTLGGIRFQYYYLGRSAIRKLKLPLLSRTMEHIPVLVLKIDKDSLNRTSPKARRWMFASGAVASMTLPWVILPSSFGIGPFWVGVFFTTLVLGNTLFTLYFSPKTGDLHRASIVKG